MNKKKIAILGATGYIGKSIAEQFFLQGDDYQVFLFSRKKQTLLYAFAAIETSGSQSAFCTLDEFSLHRYDVIINCTGIGDPKELKRNPVSIFSVTEEMDTLVFSYLEKYPDTTYINISSGAVYGSDFSKAISEETAPTFSLDASTPYDFYSIAKFYQEIKHRAYKELNIMDIRVFAFFSHFVDKSAAFLLSEMEWAFFQVQLKARCDKALQWRATLEQVV